ncbi:MAG: ABC transporter ATP-binding protein, partial [Candidatus Scatosoma sp.]
MKKKTLRRILSYVGKYPLSLIAVLIFAAAEVAATLYVPILVGDGVDLIAGAGKVDFAALSVVFVKIGISVAAGFVSKWLVGIFNNRLAFRVVRDIRNDAFDKITRLPLKYLDTHPHGDTLSRIVADADEVSDGLVMGFTQLFTGVLTICGTIALMAMTNWKIAVLVVLITPLSVFTSRFIAKRSYSFFRKQTLARGEQVAFIEESVSNLKTAQAFLHEEENAKAFDGYNRAYKDAAMSATFYSSLTNPLTRFVNNAVYALVVLFGALQIASGGGGLTVGGLTKFLSYANQYTKPFNEISGVITELSGAFVCAGRIFELLDEQEEVSDEENAELHVTEGRVEFDDVSFSYTEGQRLIENLSIGAQGGRRVAIVGKTGSGKTTLINLLMRFYDVDGGKITVDGQDVRSVTRKSLRGKYGMVLQETFLKTGTVRENLKIGRETATDGEMIAAAKACHAHGFISRLPKGYDTFLTEEVNLSAGQKQLLCIARIMLALPDMLILDEATSSVDTRTEQKISDAFDKLMTGRTCFIVAHRLSTIKNADVILVMDKGNVVEQGNHESLLKKRGAYYRLY